MLKKLHVLAGALRLRTFTVAGLATSCQVSESTVHTVLQRVPQDWFTRHVISAGNPGGQPRQYELTETGEAGIRESIGRLPSAPPLAPIQDSVSVPTGLSAARAAAERLVRVDANLAAGLREEALESLDWAEAELADGGFPSEAGVLRKEIGELRAKLAEQSLSPSPAQGESRPEPAVRAPIAAGYQTDRAPYSPSLPQALAGALRRLAQLADNSSGDQRGVRRLTPTQHKILRLLGSCDESLSLSAVARELGITAATVCDSVNALENKNLVRKQRSTTDSRALALLLTEDGQEVATQLAALPDPLWGAFDELATNEQETLYRLSIKMLRGLQERGQLPASRMCVRCKFFDPFRYGISRTPHHCHRAEMPMSDGQLRIDCAIFEAGDAEKQAAVWERFAGHRQEKPERFEDLSQEIETRLARERLAYVSALAASGHASVSARQSEKEDSRSLRPADGGDAAELLRRQVAVLRVRVAELEEKLGQGGQA